MTTASQTETLGFQTETQQILKLMIHSLYSNKEIFLRELISNASDAADKLRFEGLSDSALYENDSELKIHISYDKDAKTLTLRDNGIGMNREEVIRNIGTIAKSGTKEFMQSLTGDQAKDANLIGQFGVGFYSAFIVADKVTLTTRRAGLGKEHGVRWESAGEGDYTIANVECEQHGTEITLHLRDDETSFLNDWQLRTVVKKYSDHITLPIVLTKEDGTEETINQASALWTRPKSEITQEQYDEFYKHVAHDFEPPLAHVHARVEGKQEYTQLLYIPQRAPFDMWDREARHGIKLYVRRVFIMDDAEQLMPNYMRFIRGIIDTADLPLNVSREILQHSKDIDNIRAASVKKILGVLDDLAANQAEKYTKFWGEFGNVMKEGVIEDTNNRERIAALLRFASTTSDTQAVSFNDYIARMREGQDKIYFITADNLAAAKSSPHLEIFRKKDIEVLLLTDRIDEWVISNLQEFAGKSLQSVAKGGLDLGTLEDETEKQSQAEEADAFRELTDQVKATLGERVKEVRITHRLTDSPACLVSDANEIGGNMERILKSAGQAVPTSKPILELNPTHPIVLKVKAEMGKDKFADWSHLLFDQAMLAEGGQLENPAGFVQRLNGLILALS
jgi:molecular chaperone HtpG